MFLSPFWLFGEGGMEGRRDTFLTTFCFLMVIQMGGLHDSMESRISALEKLNQNDGSQHVQAAE